MAKRGKIQKTNAMRELERAGVSYEWRTYDDDGEEARGLGLAIARQLGEDPGQGFKTLVAQAATGSCAVCCVPVMAEIDFKAAARALGEKFLSMLPTKRLVEVTGYMRGGCSPIGMKKRLPTVIDESCLRYDRVFISGGRRGLQLVVSPLDLVDLLGATVAPITRAL